MPIRPKTIRRLLILFAVAAVMAGAMTVWLVLRIRSQQQQIDALRARAIAAYQAKHDADAVGLLGEYLSRSHTQDKDAEAVFDYGVARSRVPLERGQHLYEAIRVLQQYLRVDPDDARDARHALLKLYGQTGYGAEAKSLADAMLAARPDDVEALRAKVRVQIGEQDLASALTTCQTLNRLAPLDLEMQTVELQLMAQLKRPADQIVQHAEQLRAHHPRDPRFEALASMAYRMAHRDDDAARAIEAAAALDPADADSTIRIVGLLQADHRFDLASRYLARALQTNADPRLRRMQAQALYEQRHLAELAEQLKGVGPRSPDAPVALLGYRAAALCELNRAAEAGPLVSALGARPDPDAQAWATALSARFLHKATDPAKLIGAYDEAIRLDPTNPVFFYLRGMVHDELGDLEPAVRDFTYAIQRSPTWARAYCRISQDELRLGRSSDAVHAAWLALQIMPHDAVALTTYAAASYAALGRQGPDSDAFKRLFDLVDSIQRQAKNEPATLPIYVALLAREGERDRAIEAIKSALSANPPLPESAMARLAAASDAEHLDLGAAILDRAEQVHGLTPAIAFTRARSLYDRGQREQAMQLVASLRRSHMGNVKWQLAEAQFLDGIGDKDAAPAWAALLAAHPNDVNVQFAALASPAVRADRGRWQRAIDRVRALTGPESTTWQVEDARWQLAGSPDAKDLQALVAQLQKLTQELPTQPDPHRLLAEALLRGPSSADTFARAAAELMAAHDLQPADDQTTHRLVALLDAQGQRDRAMAVVDEVARGPSFGHDQRLWAAQTYAQFGANDTAIRLLTAPDANLANDPSALALLASAYRQDGRLDEAAAIALKLLDAPAAPPAAIAAGAELFALRKQADVAERFIARLTSAPHPPASIELLRAHIDELLSNMGAAGDAYAAATRAFPNQAQTWIELSGFYLRQVRLTEADRAAADGLAHVPGNKALEAARANVAQLRMLDPNGLGPLVAFVSRQPEDPTAGETIRLLADARARGSSAGQTVAALRQLADRHPSFLPLQELLVQREAALGNYHDAAEVASRSAAMAPRDPRPLELLAGVELAAGQWDAARDAAARWRKVSGGNPVGADVIVAATYLDQPQPDPNAALRQLAPYMAQGAPDAPRQAALPTYCHALIAAGRSDEAAALLKPMLDQSPVWRRAWMDLATAHQPDGAAAANWLSRGATAIPGDRPAERVELAQAWLHLGDRYDWPKAYESARDVLRPIIGAATPPPSTAAWITWAGASQDLDDRAEAEHAWREVLKRTPNDPAVKNNLAYVLLLQGGDRLPEAERLAREAVAAAPGVSTFYDTLARIELRASHPTDAVRDFHAALDRDPNNVEAMIGLADVLQSRPADRDEARSLLNRINAATVSGAPLQPMMRKQLDRLRTALSSSS